MTQLLWILIAVQIAMAAFDTIYHHELTERLAWRHSQRHELALHAARSFLYTILFAALGFIEVRGVLAMAVIAILIVEVVITLTDFVEEDMSRKLPASERINHTLLAINYGAILALIAPVLARWSAEPASITMVSHGWWSAVAAFGAFGAALFGLRDFLASKRGDPRTAPAAELVSPMQGRQTVLVTGATGFVGSRLTQALAEAGHDVIVLTRNPTKAGALKPPFRLITALSQLPDDTSIDAIVNLAGEPIANGWWTRGKRRSILNSRLEMTADILRFIERLAEKPGVLVNASAVGWYGLHDNETLTEATDGRPCFTREICSEWERVAMQAEKAGVRVVLLRFGIVLGTEGGMLANLLPPFEYGLGGPFGSGRQWVSWIERDDLIRLISHTIASRTLTGPVNATAPEPVRNATFVHELGRALRRPAMLRVPAAPLRLLAGDLADELLLGGQKVVPEKALSNGFVFRHPNLRAALAAILPAPHAKRTEMVT